MREGEEPPKKRRRAIRPIAANPHVQLPQSDVYTDQELDEIDARRAFLIPSIANLQHIEDQAARKINALAETLLPCCVCELDCERDDIAVYKPTDSLLAELRRRLIVRKEDDVPQFIQAQYDASHIDKRLEGLLLLPEGIPHTDGIFQLMICNACMSQMRTDKTDLPPTLAIANGNYIGHMPDELQLSRTDEQAVALVSPCMSLSTVSGGACRSLKSHHYVVRNTEGPLVSMLPTDLSTRVRVTMVGSMTPVQAAACRKRYEINLPRCRSALAFLQKNNRDYQAYMEDNHDHGELAPGVNERSVVVNRCEEMGGVGSIDETVVNEIRDDSSYSRRDVDQGTPSLETVWEDRSSVILPLDPGQPSGFTDVLVRKSNNFVSLRSWAACTRMFPVLFPGGCGGPTEPRRRHLTVQKWIQRCLRIHGHAFERHYAFLLLAFDYLASKNARDTLFVKMHVSTAALKASQIPRSTLHEALKYYKYVVEAQGRGCKPRPPPPDVQKVVDLRRGIRSSESAFYGSNLSRMRARHDVFGMLKRFGPMQLFLTVSPDSSGTYSIAVRSGAVQTRAVREANLQLLPNKSERRAIAAQHPFECARYFVRVMDTVIEDMLGWDQRCGRPKRGGGVFGIVRAFAAAAETQVAGDLHAHLVVWLHGFPQTSAAIGRALEEDEDFRSRLLDLADTVLTTVPPCISGDEELTCPKCHSASALFPIVPSVGAFRRPAASGEPEATSQCSACRSTFRDRDVINAAIAALAGREEVRVVAETTDYTRCRPPITPESDLSVSLIVRDVQMHFWNHTRSCFKVTVQTPKGSVCRFFKPEPPHLGRTCIEDGRVRLHRPIGCEYVNGYNKTLLAVLRCNHDVKFVLCADSKNTAAYICKYCMKAQNPVENNAALSIAAFAKAVNRTDGLPPDSTPNQVGRSILGSMLYTVTNGQEVAAPMAALYLIRESPFWLSHEPVHVNLGAALDTTSTTEEICVDPSLTESATSVTRSGTVLDKYRRRPLDKEGESFVEFCERHDAKPSKHRSSSQFVRPGVVVVCGRELPDMSSHVNSDDRDFYYSAVLTLFKPHRVISSILDGRPPQSAYSHFIETGRMTLVRQMEVFEQRLQDAYMAEKRSTDGPAHSREDDLMKTHPAPSTPWRGESTTTSALPATPTMDDDIPTLHPLFQEDQSRTISTGELATRARAIVDSVRNLSASIVSTERGYHRIESMSIPPDFSIDSYETRLVKSSMTAENDSTGTEMFIQEFRDARTRLERLQECFEPVPWCPQLLPQLSPSQLPAFPTIKTTSAAFQLNFWQHAMFEVVARHLLFSYSGDIESELHEPLFPDDHTLEPYQMRPQLRAYMGGEAGTGKSTVIHAILAFAEKWGRAGTVETLAFTGVAAINIHGRTLHSARHLELRGGGPSGTPSLEMKSRFRQVVLVIIDEVSMTDQRLLGGTDTVSRSMSSLPKEIMGGKHFLLVGDWFQLPPIGGSPCFRSPAVTDNSLRKAGHETYMAINFVIFLTENMRARKDAVYTELLSELRWGRLSNSHLKLLNSRVQTNLHAESVPADRDYYHPIVVSTNKLRCAINTVMAFRAAARFHIPLYECSAIPSSRSRTIVDKLTNANDDLTDHIPIRLLFYIGMPIMITRKHPDLLDAEAIANGVLGTITGFVPASNADQFDVNMVENVEVRKFKLQPKLLLVKILYSTRSFVSGFPPGVIGLPSLKATLKLNNIPNLSRTTVTVQQFPVIPAFACTTEKLQGQTCHDGIIVTKLERQKGVPRQTLYVALSRSTTLSKVTLTEPITRGYLAKFVPAPPTIEEMQRLISLVEMPQYATLNVRRTFQEWIQKQT